MTAITTATSAAAAAAKLAVALVATLLCHEAGATNCYYCHGPANGSHCGELFDTTANHARCDGYDECFKYRFTDEDGYEGISRGCLRRSHNDVMVCRAAAKAVVPRLASVSYCVTCTSDLCNEAAIHQAVAWVPWLACALLWACWREVCVWRVT